MLAHRSGVPRSQLKHIVHRRANPSVVDVLRLANAFGVRVADLADREMEAGLPSDWPVATIRYDAERFGAAFGGRLRAYRKRRGLSLRPFATLANIARNTLRSVEISTVSPGTRIVVRIAAGLGLSFGDFVESLHSSVLAFTSNETKSADGARDLLQDAAGDDVLHMQEVVLQRGRALQRPAGSPGSRTMAYAVEGSVRIAFESETVTLKPGEAALLASDQEFMITGLGARSARLLIVVRTPDVETREESE